ncbi:hypothetical protein GCM10017688_61700 [Streptomyces ramulosus]
MRTGFRPVRRDLAAGAPFPAARRGRRREVWWRVNVPDEAGGWGGGGGRGLRGGRKTRGGAGPPGAGGGARCGLMRGLSARRAVNP